MSTYTSTHILTHPHDHIQVPYAWQSQKRKRWAIKPFPGLRWKMQKKAESMPPSEPSGWRNPLVQSHLTFTSSVLKCSLDFQRTKITDTVIIFHHHTRYIKYKRTFLLLHFILNTRAEKNQPIEVIQGQEVGCNLCNQPGTPPTASGWAPEPIMLMLIELDE